MSSSCACLSGPPVRRTRSTGIERALIVWLSSVFGFGDSTASASEKGMLSSSGTALAVSPSLSAVRREIVMESSSVLLHGNENHAVRPADAVHRRRRDILQHFDLVDLVRVER